MLLSNSQNQLFFAGVFSLPSFGGRQRLRRKDSPGHRVPYRIHSPGHPCWTLLTERLQNTYVESAYILKRWTNISSVHEPRPVSLSGWCLRSELCRHQKRETHGRPKASSLMICLLNLRVTFDAARCVNHVSAIGHQIILSWTFWGVPFCGIVFTIKLNRKSCDDFSQSFE